MKSCTQGSGATTAPAFSSSYTPGPWDVGPHENDRRAIIRPSGRPFEAAVVAHVFGHNVADSYLVAAAPDHADIGWAMCVAAGRWEPWGEGRGEFVFNGIAFATELDQFGVPKLTAALRDQIWKARGAS